ncbi:MAG: phosphodiester glycosidase family protein [Muribaculaceae bacterium]
MKKLLLALTLTSLGCGQASADFIIDEKSYTVDTLVLKMVGPGVKHMVVRLPEVPINAYLLETDLTNPYVKAQGVQGNDTLGYVERLDANAKRMRERGLKPIGGNNGNFWCWPASNETDKSYMFQSPYGASAQNGITYVNTNEIVNVWQSPEYSAVAAVDDTGKAFVGDLYWEGTVKGDKIEDQTLVCINRRNRPDQIVLWNAAFGRNREFENDWLSHSEKGTNNTDNYYLTFKDGYDWATNADLHFTVSKIVKGTDRLKLGEYDACLGATGNKKAALETLSEGDEIVINSGWRKISTGERPHIMEAVEGNGMVMKNGELTDRNTVDSYNSQVYSRNCIGTNADGTKLYMLVIDKATHWQWGVSAGSTTSVMCQILKNLCPDVTDISNLDAGGSAQMMLDYQIVNKTTENTARAVNNGMFVMCVSPDDNEIASIAFLDHRIEMPVYSSYTPVILGYNKYGELIDQNVQGVNIIVPSELGSANGDCITASGNVSAGVIKAELNGMEASVIQKNLPADMAISIRPTITIDSRTAEIPVTATVNNEVFYYDPTHLDWSVGDATVATVTDGKLTGIESGKTTLQCSVGDFNDQVDVDVQISEIEYYDFNWKDWTVKGSGAKNLVLGEDGVLNYDYSSGRTPYIQLTKEELLYSLPDSIGLVFNSSQPIASVRLDVRYPGGKSAQTIKPEEGDVFAAGVDHRVKVDFDKFGGAEAITTYPVTFSVIYFSLGTADAGSYSINLKSLYAHYPYTTGGVDEVSEDGSNVKISTENGEISVSGAKNVKIYDIAGRIISAGAKANVAQGIYIIVADGESHKIVVK